MLILPVSSASLAAHLFSNGYEMRELVVATIGLISSSYEKQSWQVALALAMPEFSK